MAQESLEHAQQTLETLHTTLEQRASQGGTHLFAEPFLMQTLMVVAAFLPAPLEPHVRAIIDQVRLHKEYGCYLSYATDQYPGEQIVSLHEDETAAAHSLERVQACDVTGRIAPLTVSSSLLPGGEPSAQSMWAVLVSSEVDRQALLHRLYPQLGARHHLGSIIAAYDRTGQR